jgi:hypothetical protein
LALTSIPGLPGYHKRRTSTLPTDRRFFPPPVLRLEAPEDNSTNPQIPGKISAKASWAQKPYEKMLLISLCFLDLFLMKGIYNYLEQVEQLPPEQVPHEDEPE